VLFRSGDRLFPPVLWWLADTLELWRPNIFDELDRDAFLADAERIKQVAQSETDEAVVVGLARLMATIGETHTYLDWPGSAGRVPFRRYPVRAAFFADGVFIIQATEQNRDLIATRITRLGDRPVADVLADVEAVTGADNQWTHRFLGPRRIPVVSS